MQTVTLKYETQKRVKTLIEDEGVLKLYQKMFGKRKDNKYTENEIFLFNSKLNASKSFAKYL